MAHGINHISIKGHFNEYARHSLVEETRKVPEGIRPPSASQLDAAYLGRFALLGYNSGQPDRYALPSDEQDYRDAVETLQQIEAYLKTIHLGGCALRSAILKETAPTALGIRAKIIGSIDEQLSRKLARIDDIRKTVLGPHVAPAYSRDAGIGVILMTFPYRQADMEPDKRREVESLVGVTVREMLEKHQTLGLSGHPRMTVGPLRPITVPHTPAAPQKTTKT